MNTAIRLNSPLMTEGAETVTELLRRNGIDPATRFIAVSVNGSVVRRIDWPATQLAKGDDVEVVRPFQGG
jgi:thiamine biosynthesis protein ThiS